MAVKMSEEVWLTCLSHSLTTETEEIMGLLFGDIQHVKNRGSVAMIWGASPEVRSDRRKDRVEVRPEQLAAASAQAEKMTITSGRTTRVIGWYHSHPHITVLPSHVDVRTQAMFQQLDPGFIGLIFSCFSEDAQKVGRIQVIAFQSLDGKQRSMMPLFNSSLLEVESSWSSSDNASPKSLSANNTEDTCDSEMAKSKKVGGRSSGLEEFFSHDDVNYLGKQRKRENSLALYNAGNSDTHSLDVESMDMSVGMQEALHRSNLDVSSAEYVRKEVPFQVLPSKALLNLNNPLSSYVVMQNVLFEEEKAAYNQAILQNTENGRIHPLTYIHHTSTYQASLCKLMEYCLSPAINTLQSLAKENEIRLAQLRKEAESLELEALGCNEDQKMITNHRRLPAVSARASPRSSVVAVERNSRSPRSNPNGSSSSTPSQQSSLDLNK